MKGKIESAIEYLKQALEETDVNPERGLGEKLFLFTSMLTPIVNVDLLIMNEKKEILLSWRDDTVCGKGWHIPGGCLRLKETLQMRIHKCAVSELGSDVYVEDMPLLIKENIAGVTESGSGLSQTERSHFISFLFECSIVDLNKLKNCDGKQKKGHLGWFDYIPDDFLKLQYFYLDFINNWFQEKRNGYGI